MRPSLHWGKYLPLGLVVLLVAGPLMALGGSWWAVDARLWQHLWQTQLAELIGNTLLLLAGVGVGVLGLGVPLAWLTARCAFPGRGFFAWALLLPLAVPTYVLAFVVLGIFDYAGPLQSWLRALGYPGFIDLRHPLMVIGVMSAVLYPYVYLLARAAFLAQGAQLVQAARGLGCSPWQAFWQVALPAARPAILAGLSLALMEALADFGAVSIFGFNTFTTAIYKSWFGLFSLATAAQLATLLLLFVGGVLVLTRMLRAATREAGRTAPHRAPPVSLSAGVGWLAFGFCAVIFALTVLLPVAQLLLWAWPSLSTGLTPAFAALVGRTFALGAFAALGVVGVACALAATATSSPHRATAMLGEFATLGYALPGSVLAVGIMLVLAAFDWWYAGGAPMLLGSLAGLLYAYLVRFLRPAHGAVQAGLARAHRHHLEVAALLGASPWRRFWRVRLPLILPGVLTALLLVFVDVIKEMPATLLLRPFGWDTLATKLYELTAEGHWQRAASSALALIGVSLGPVLLLIRSSSGDRGTAAQ
ncbi:MAG: iron ABC transporter permease [Cellvibrionales bacterium]|nr:iron ABC transporter permease [Cellvibrionales bacterium]